MPEWFVNNCIDVCKKLSTDSTFKSGDWRFGGWVVYVRRKKAIEVWDFQRFMELEYNNLKKVV